MKKIETWQTVLGTLGIIAIFVAFWFFYVGCCIFCLCPEDLLSETRVRIEGRYFTSGLSNTPSVVVPYQPPSKPTGIAGGTVELNPVEIPIDAGGNNLRPAGARPCGRG